MHIVDGKQLKEFVQTQYDFTYDFIIACMENNSTKSRYMTDRNSTDYVFDLEALNIKYKQICKDFKITIEFRHYDGMKL